MIKEQKEQRTVVTKQRLKFNDYKNCLLNNERILKSQQRFKSEAHNVCPEEINNDKRLQTYDKILHHILMEQVLEKYVKQRC